MQDDLRAAWPTTLLYNANRAKNASPKGPGDFFPSLNERRELTPEEQLERARAIGRRMAGLDD